MRQIFLAIMLGVYMNPIVLEGNDGIPAEGRMNASAFSSGKHFGLWDDDLLRGELDFIIYLISRDDYAESLFLLERLQPTGFQLIDSVSYLTGWVLYRQKKLEASAKSLLQVRPASPVFHKSHFFGAYNLAHAGKHQQAISVLNEMPVEPGTMLEAMQRFQLGGVSLLKRDFEGYRDQAREFSGDFHVMAQQESRLGQYYEQLKHTSPKSPFLAGMMSAAVPGLGRVYAGKPAEGIVSFLYLAAFGFTSYDFYRGGGLESPLFIISAGVTTIFYAGNIMGSVVAARRVNNEFHYEMDQRILFDLHIPLRNAFN